MDLADVMNLRPQRAACAGVGAYDPAQHEPTCDPTGDLRMSAAIRSIERASQSGRRSDMADPVAAAARLR